MKQKFKKKTVQVQQTYITVYYTYNKTFKYSTVYESKSWELSIPGSHVAELLGIWANPLSPSSLVRAWGGHCSGQV